MVHKQKPQHKEPVTAASRNMRSNFREVIDASAPNDRGLGQAFSFTNHAFEEGKRLETNLLARHKGKKAHNYSIRHVSTGHNSVASGRVMTEHQRHPNTHGLVDILETAGASNHTMKPQWKSLDPQVPFNMADYSAPVLYNSPTTKSAKYPNSVQLLSTNNGPNFADPLSVASSKRSRSNPGYTKDAIPGVGQDFHGAFNVERGIKLPNRMLGTGQTQASSVTNTGVSSKFLQCCMIFHSILLIIIDRQRKNSTSSECIEACVF